MKHDKFIMNNISILKWKYICYTLSFIPLLNIKWLKIYKTDLCPPLSSLSESFQTAPNPILTSKPSRTVWPSGGESLACVPGSKVEKMEPKSCNKRDAQVKLKFIFKHHDRIRKFEREIVRVKDGLQNFLHFNFIDGEICRWIDKIWWDYHIFIYLMCL